MTMNPLRRGPRDRHRLQAHPYRPSVSKRARCGAPFSVTSTVASIGGPSAEGPAPTSRTGADLYGNDRAGCRKEISTTVPEAFAQRRTSRGALRFRSLDQWIRLALWGSSAMRIATATR
jgi:hypothetical protein